MKLNRSLTILAFVATCSMPAMNKDKYLMIVKLDTHSSQTLYRAIPKDISAEIFISGRFELHPRLKQDKYCYTLPNPSGITTDSEKAKITFAEVHNEYELQQSEIAFSESLEMFKEEN